MNYGINDKESALARECMNIALREGADKVRLALSKSVMNLIGILDGEVDKITRCLDRSIDITIFADGRFGVYSTNELKPGRIEDFIRKAVRTTRMLAPDEFRTLPERSRICKGAINGNELEQLDGTLDSLSQEERIKTALGASLHRRKPIKGGPKLISEEGEYSDEFTESLLLDSEGLCARTSQTIFEYGVEITVQDEDGNRYSSFWWDSSTRFNKVKWKSIGKTAYIKAMQKANPRSRKSFRGKMVVDRCCASKLVKPILSSLSAMSVQQHNSFLEGKTGQKVFSEKLNILNDPFHPGMIDTRLFDSEGVSVREFPIIENGVPMQYFVNTYMSGKMGIPPTAEEAVAPLLKSTLPDGGDAAGLMKLCSEGLYVTSFNGGNYDPATGDFSYGIEGFYFKGGEIKYPVKEMLVTGNYLSLWNNFCAAGSDARPGNAKRIPSLAFENVDFNG